MKKLIGIVETASAGASGVGGVATVAAPLTVTQRRSVRETDAILSSSDEHHNPLALAGTDPVPQAPKTTKKLVGGESKDPSVDELAEELTESFRRFQMTEMAPVVAAAGRMALGALASSVAGKALEKITGSEDNETEPVDENLGAVGKVVADVAKKAAKNPQIRQAAAEIGAGLITTAAAAASKKLAQMLKVPPQQVQDLAQAGQVGIPSESQQALIVGVFKHLMKNPGQAGQIFATLQKISQEQAAASQK